MSYDRSKGLGSPDRPEIGGRRVTRALCGAGWGILPSHGSTREPGCYKEARHGVSSPGHGVGCGTMCRGHAAVMAGCRGD